MTEITTKELVTQFLDKYYKPKRYHGRGEEYAQALLISHIKDYMDNGYDIISKFDSVTGKMEFIGKLPWKSKSWKYTY